MVKSRRRQHPQTGFVLVLTMWVLAAIAIAATYFSERVQKSLQLAAARQGTNDGQIELSDARAELLFRLATTPMTPYGLGARPNSITLDDRAYAIGRTTVKLQDGRGLFNLNTFSDEQMLRLLATLGVPAERGAGLIDTLRDYADADDLRRLNGAELSQYKDLNLPPPRNAPLVLPNELRQIIGWRDTPLLWQENSQLLELTNTDASTGLNPNTAPWQVLTTLPNVTEAIAKAIIERRQIEPVTAAWLDQMLGTRLDVGLGPVWAFPSDTVRITQRASGLPWVLRYNVKLTPEGATSPWSISYSYRLDTKGAAYAPRRSPNPQHPLNAIDPPKLPPRAALPASSPFLF